MAKKVAQDNDEKLSDYLRNLIVEDLEKRGAIKKETLLSILKRR